MLTDIQAVIFDLDGTLIDSMWLWQSIDEEYLKLHHIDMPDGFQDDLEGMSFTETARYFKERFQLSESIEKIKDDWNKMAWDYYAHRVDLKDGVVAFLDYLRNKELPIGIGTSNSRELVELVVSKYHIEKYFTSIRTSCEVDKGKPHPDIYLKVASDLGVDPSTCLVFEDIPNGIVAAKRAGMKVCAIEDDFSKAMKDRKVELADYFIESYYEVMK